MLLVAILTLGLFQGRIADAGWWGAAVIATSLVAVALATQHVHSRGKQLAFDPPDWFFIVIDTILALGLITLLANGAAPMAWVALVVPVVEAALVYNLGTAVAVWSFIGLCHLAWTFNVAASSDTAQISLTSSLQQLLAILLIAIPTSLLAGSFRDQLRQLGTANALASRDTAALHLVGGRVGQMSAMTSPAEVLASCVEGSVELGFVAAEILVPSPNGWRVLAARHPKDRSIVAPHVLAGDATSGTGVADLLPNTEDNRQNLHLYGAGFGRAILLQTESGSVRPVLRVWAVPNSTPEDHNLDALDLLAAQTANVHDTVHAAVQVAQRTRELAFQASHDQLTSLANHRTIVSTLERLVGGEHPTSLLFIDLDGFKPINDTHGHDAGDQALVIVARRLEQVVGNRGLVGRLGGDEFVVMGPSQNLASQEHPFGLASYILAAIREPMLINGLSMTLSASIGAAAEVPGLASEELLKRADQAMYAAKQAGAGLRAWSVESALPQPAGHAQ